MTKRPLAEITAALETALEQLNDAAAKSRNARMQETERLNIVNGIQKEFDAAISDLRKSAPRDTDWGRPKGEGR